MNTFVLLALMESMGQPAAGTHDLRRWYMTVHVVNHGIIISITILTMVVHPIKKFDLGNPRDCVHQEGKWTQVVP
jgi:hypothetical protein